MSRKTRKRNRKLRTKPSRKSGFTRLCWDIAKMMTKERRDYNHMMQWDKQSKQPFCISVIGTVVWCKDCVYQNSCLKGEVK